MRETENNLKDNSFFFRGNIKDLESSLRNFLQPAISIRQPSENTTKGTSKSLGNHVIADFANCKRMPSSADDLEQTLLRVATAIHATVVASTFHEFNPHGMSGVVVIAESHLAAHTWPEFSQICIDLFTCSNDMDSALGLRLLYEAFDADTLLVRSISRGLET